MTYTPPDKVRLLGREATLRSTGVVDYYEARMDKMPIEAMVSRAARTGEVYATIECGHEGDGQPVAHLDSAPDIESAVDWANAKVRELLTEALREIEWTKQEEKLGVYGTKIPMRAMGSDEEIAVWTVGGPQCPADRNPVAVDAESMSAGDPRIVLWGPGIPINRLVGYVSADDARKMMSKP